MGNTCTSHWVRLVSNQGPAILTWVFHFTWKILEWFPEGLFPANLGNREDCIVLTSRKQVFKKVGPHKK